MVLLGAAGPDKIELEKALRRWTELSWFLDEVEVSTGSGDGDGELPKAWRVGNRPNLRQMHHDACTTRVPPPLVEAQIINAIEKLKVLTSGASAAGAKVHNLPERPRDIADDGEFHYAVLGPQAASESGKPSSEARRFIDETTAPDRPRVYRNAVVLAVLSRDGLEAARRRAREYLGWEEVRDQLKDQQIDPIRDQMLINETEAARKHVPGAIKQAYSVVVTVNETNQVHAFKVVVTDEPLFATIKVDPRARIQETAISSEAMMPDGPYGLWHDGEHSHRVKDLVGAFARFPKLPKMLRRKEILDTVVHGVAQGTWVAQVLRPDRTARTFWRTAVDETALDDPGLEVLLPEEAALSELAPELLGYQKLPGLWPAEEIKVQDVFDYFAGGQSVSIPREGYEETLVIPKCDPARIEESIAQAVEQGLVWLTSGPASILKETLPAGVFSAAALLRPPPERIEVPELMEPSIPDAWKEGRTNVLAIATALSTKRGANLPWSTVRSVIEDGIRASWIELSKDSAPWPCEITGAQQVIIQVPTAVREAPPVPRPQGLLTAEANLEANAIQDLSDQVPEIAMAAVGNDLRFNVRVEFGGKTPPDPAAVEKINQLLSEVSDDLRLE